MPINVTPEAYKSVLNLVIEAEGDNKALQALKERCANLSTKTDLVIAMFGVWYKTFHDLRKLTPETSSDIQISALAALVRSQSALAMLIATLESHEEPEVYGLKLRLQGVLEMLQLGHKRGLLKFTGRKLTLKMLKDALTGKAPPVLPQSSR